MTDNMVAMRMLSSSNSAADRTLLQDFLSGNATLGSMNGQGQAQTVLENGVRNINLGDYQSLGQGMDPQFALGVLLSHEAMRNGVDDGAAGQAQETFDAVGNHIGMEAQVFGTYGKGSLAGYLGDEFDTYKEAVANKDNATLAKIFGSYDSSADYWKLKHNKDGSYNLNWDGNANITDADTGKLLADYNPELSARIEELEDIKNNGKDGAERRKAAMELRGLSPQYEAGNRAGVGAEDVANALMSLAQSDFGKALVGSNPDLIVDMSRAFVHPFGSASVGPYNLLPVASQVPSSRQAIGDNLFADVLDAAQLSTPVE